MRNLRETTILSFIFMLFYSFNVYAQNFHITIHPKGWRTIEEMETVDSGKIRIWYALNALDITNKNTYDDWQCLEIGNNLSRYYSYFIFLSDSVCTEWLKKRPGAQSSPRSCSRGGKKYDKWSEYYFSDYVKDFAAGRLTVDTQMAYGVPNYQYTEDLPAQDWTLHDDTLTIAGHLCQKAECRFRGRDFTAWFAPEIPISNGPWKFGGLPGLILKVCDADNLYDFECNKIQSYEKEYPLKIRKTKYREIDREKYMKLLNDVYDNYSKVVGIFHMDGTPVITPPEPYHPLELE